MRTSTTLLLTAGLLLTASSVFAQEEGDPARQAPCDMSTYKCSQGSVSLKTVSRKNLGSALSSGWIPKCSGGEENCGRVQFKASVDLVPVKSPAGEELNVYEILIGEKGKNVYVDAHWPDVGKINLSLPEASEQYGRLFVRHGAKVNLSLYVDIKVFKKTFNIPLNSLLAKLPGSTFNNYMAENGTGFVPWAFKEKPAELEVEGKKLEDSVLVQTSLTPLWEFINIDWLKDNVKGSLSALFTTDLKFNYKTNKVVFKTPNGELDSESGVVSIDSNNDDTLQLQPTAEGTLSYEGEILFRPGIKITEPIEFNFAPDVHANIKVASTEQAVSLESEKPLIIPLPNVMVEAETLSFPKTETGKTSEIKKIAVTNTGLLPGLVEVTSDNPAFKVINKSGTVDARVDNANGEFDIEVRFAPRSAGKITGKLTVTTNDPDTPVVTVDLSGTGEGKDLGPDPDDEQPTSDGGTHKDGSSAADDVLDSESDSGCGCTVPGSSNFGAAGAALAALALGTVAARRRRR